MNKYKIILCDDNTNREGSIKVMLRSIQKEFEFMEFGTTSFNSILTDEGNPLSDVDLLILDLYDKDTDSWLGIQCLSLLKSTNSSIKTIIFSGDKDGPERKRNFKEEFSFVIHELDKDKDEMVGLKNVVEEELILNIDDQFEIDNPFDDLVQLQIKSIGRNNLNQICLQLKDKFEIVDDIVFSKMVGGYSGAILLKFQSSNTNYILKLSKNTPSLIDELENSNKYYHKFPHDFFNYINPHRFESKNKNVVAIVIKLIEGSETFFSFATNTSTSSDSICEVLNKLFFEGESMNDHYSKHRSDEEHWSSIFDTFSNGKFNIIQNIYSELKPLTGNLNINDLENMVVNQSFESLNKKNLNIKSQLTLNHGDFHSKNILVKNNNPYIIDTGGMKNGYWCLDICRLIVDLFIRGLDIGTINYFDISNISTNVEYGEKLITQEKISLDSRNDSLLVAINWINENINQIYGDLFSITELQLGLVREFLQASYRVDTLPPNKRAIALILAIKTMEKANENAS